MVKARVEMLLATMFTALLLITVIWPTWIESISGLDPDGGNGGLEWLVVVVFAVLAAGTALLSRHDYRVAKQLRNTE